jgi:hypothetical protein
MNEWYDVTLKFALCHYYHGSMKHARKYLLLLLARNPFEILPWRYFVPSLAGDRFFRLIRKFKLSDSFTNFFRERRNKYFAP